MKPLTPSEELLAEHLAAADNLLRQLTIRGLPKDQGPGYIGAQLALTTALLGYASMSPEDFANEHKREELFGKQLNLMRAGCELLASGAELPKGIFAGDMRRILQEFPAKH